MDTRKEHLLKHGKIDAITRGRISGVNLKWLEEEWNKGVRYSDWSPEEGTKKAITKTTTVVSRKSENTENLSGISDYTEIYPENQFVVFQRVDGKRFYRSMREACQHCRVSLTQCQCDTVGREPLIVATDGRGSVPVTIERKP